jgi:hypothetical protein
MRREREQSADTTQRGRCQRHERGGAARQVHEGAALAVRKAQGGVRAPQRAAGGPLSVTTVTAAVEGLRAAAAGGGDGSTHAERAESV